MTLPSVLVTGGAKRLGRGICERFAEAGWHVLVHYNRSSDSAEALAAALPSAQAVQCDLSDPLAGEDMVRNLADKLGDWPCLVNCASMFKADEVTRLDPVTNARSMTINAASPALMAQTYLASAKSNAGRCVIQVTDQKLANLNPDFFSYTMSKSAADIAARMLAMAVKGNDRVHTLSPGAILPSHDQSAQEADRSHTLNLLQRRTGVAEVADAALFLAEGPLASGQNIHVDSGQHLLDQTRDVIFIERKGSEA